MKPLLFIACCTLFNTATAQWQYGKTITIDKPVYLDLYITGGNILINAPVHGDLVVAGGTITVNDTVTNDILLAGGEIIFNGYVGDDIRCAAGKLQLYKSVAGDVVVTGGSILIHPGVVTGNVITAGGDVTLNGTIIGMLKSTSGNLVLNGDVMRSIDCRGANITINGKVHGTAILGATEKITIGNNAFFSGQVRYWAPNDVDFKQSAAASHLVYDPSVRVNYARWYYLGFTSLVALLWYSGMVLVLIMLIQYLFSATFKKAGDAVFRKPLPSLGWGALFFIGIPLAVALSLITIVGVPIGIMLLAAYIILILLSSIITAVVLVNWLNNRTGNNWKYWRMVFAGFVLFIVFKIISLTPFFGWLIAAVLVCIAFGSVLINIKWRKQPVNSVVK